MDSEYAMRSGRVLVEGMSCDASVSLSLEEQVQAVSFAFCYKYITNYIAENFTSQI